MVGLNRLFCMYIHAIRCQPEAFSQQSETYLMSEVKITNKEVTDFTRPLMCFFTQPCSVWYLEYLKEGRRCGIKEKMRWAAEVISQRLIPHSRVEILEPNWATGRQMRRRERKTAKDGITSPKWNPQNDVAWHAMLGNHTAAHPKTLFYLCAAIPPQTFPVHSQVDWPADWSVCATWPLSSHQHMECV